MHDLFQNDWSTLSSVIGRRKMTCFWRKSEMWFVCRSLSRRKNHRRGSGDQWVNIGASRFVMIWWRAGGVLRDIWEGDEGLRIFRTLENSREILEEPQEDPKASFRKFEVGKRLGGACGQYKAFWNFCGLWSDVLSVSGEDVIFFPLKFIIHSCQKIVKSVWKMTEEYFSNLPSSMLSEVTLYLFERQEDRERGAKRGTRVNGKAE